MGWVSSTLKRSSSSTLVSASAVRVMVWLVCPSANCTVPAVAPLKSAAEVLPWTSV